jgi:hypothetical protein
MHPLSLGREGKTGTRKFYEKVWGWKRRESARREREGKTR